MEGVENLTFKQVKFDYTSATTTNGQPVVVKSSSGITFRGDKFDGELVDSYGTGTGIKISQGSDIQIVNSNVWGYRKGIETWAVDGLTIQNTKVHNISYDGIVSGHVQGLRIIGNTVEMNANPAEDQHRDVIQIYNEGGKAPSSDVLIAKNTLTATDTTTHGIYAGNADAKSTGSASEFYSDFVIRDNKIMTGQKLGLAIGQIDGVTITGNTVIQNDALDDNSRTVAIPIVHVAQESGNVAVTENILNGKPIAADDTWQEVKDAGSGWTISDNAVVALSWRVGESTEDPYADVRGNGVADEFRYKGSWVANGGDRVDENSNVNFDEGDTIVLINYEENSFKGVYKGNQLDVNSTGTYVKIDSITDLQELAASSPKLSAEVSGDTLTLHITQTGGVHDIVLGGLGQEYQSSYDASLF
ncbi:right-handed parallel beta-helix repeat-containing protein [Amaricoccus solimangrovi]|uniref:right-handed parallel beta-helix repeat-containing protein n=1 Tax=Amaricoccus solimangrovi TaxID=2589815 RepID=UPI0015E2A809|nr:right-handed parallel beta-helix repeat-containing protein [Amaricoccus solimangrovi]